MHASLNTVPFSHLREFALNSNTVALFFSDPATTENV